jgi:hypothetical protein
MDLCQHLNCIRAGAITTEDGVKCALVDDGIKGTVLVLKHTHIHLLVHKSWKTLFVCLSHLLYDCEGDVDIVYMLVPILKHFLGETCK